MGKVPVYHLIHGVLIEFRSTQVKNLEIGSASNVKSLLFLIEVQQQTQRDDPAGRPKQFNNAISDNVSVGKYFVEIDAIRYPKSSMLITRKANI